MLQLEVEKESVNKSMSVKLVNVLHVHKSYQMSVQNDNKLNVQRTVPHPNCFIKSRNAHTPAVCY